MKNWLLMISALLIAGCGLTHKRNTPNSGEDSSQEIALTKAQATLKGMEGTKVKGIIHFTEEDTMKIETIVEGLKPGPHGFHIHEVGDCSKPDFSSAGGHFNPTKQKHGPMSGDHRHNGDLGNLMADSKGKAHTALQVRGLTLKPGPESILGKAVIIHQDKDDLKSQPAGNSGPRIACGVIQAL